MSIYTSYKSHMVPFGFWKPHILSLTGRPSHANNPTEDAVRSSDVYHILAYRISGIFHVGENFGENAAWKVC